MPIIISITHIEIIDWLLILFLPIVFKIKIRNENIDIFKIGLFSETDNNDFVNGDK